MPVAQMCGRTGRIAHHSISFLSSSVAAFSYNCVHCVQGLMLPCVVRSMPVHPLSKCVHCFWRIRMSADAQGRAA
jgi:hypothetical protein